MLKVDLIYPVKVEKQSDSLDLHCDEFGLTVSASSIIEAVAQMKQAILTKIATLHNLGEEPPLPKAENFKDTGVIYIEIESAAFKFFCERINLTIPKNLLSAIDAKGLNRSSYISNLILQDLLKHN